VAYSSLYRTCGEGNWGYDALKCSAGAVKHGQNQSVDLRDRGIRKIANCRLQFCFPFIIDRRRIEKDDLRLVSRFAPASALEMILFI
jgi:hypothetical protein